MANFFVAARGRERKKLFLYCHYYYSNRVENMIKVIDLNELENLADLYVFIWGTARLAATTVDRNCEISDLDLP
jgi:hypothetical protein